MENSGLYDLRIPYKCNLFFLIGFYSVVHILFIKCPLQVSEILGTFNSSFNSTTNVGFPLYAVNMFNNHWLRKNLPWVYDRAE